MSEAEWISLGQEECQKSLDKNLPLIYSALEKAQITYSEDQIEHVAEDAFMAGWMARHQASAVSKKEK